MARIKLDLPEQFTFTTSMDVRVSDLNYGNHLGNDRMVSLIHEARLRFLNHHDFAEFNIGGLGLIVSDVAVTFKAESFFGDRLVFEVGLADFNKYGCDVIYRITNEESKALVAEAKTGIVFFDYDERKISLTPNEFLKRCAPDQLS